MKAYLDLPSGISGDIFLGCLVDLGWPIEELQQIPKRLNLPDDVITIGAEEVMRGALRATSVVVDAAVGDEHRHLHHIVELINASDLPADVQSKAIAVFRRLAQAEAKVHGSDVESVHFHEVGALDAIVDIVGVCAGLDALGIDDLYASALPLGPGWVNSAHGRIPLPAPATLELLAAAEAPTVPAPGSGELVTPTGAALVCELATFGQPAMRLSRIGLGAGKKEFEWPNIPRIWLGAAEEQQRRYVVAETNIDDMNPELFDAARHALEHAGATDVWTTQVQMKKGRPGTVLSVLAPAEIEQAVADTIIRETSTLGVRLHEVHRHEAERRFETVETDYGSIPVKLKVVDGKVIGVKPEYDDCAALADDRGIPVRDVIEAALAIAHQQYVNRHE